MSKDRDLASLRQELDNVQNLNSSFHEQLEHIHKENLLLTDDNTFLRKKISSHQQEINNSHNECVRLESELYQHVQEIERLRKENVGFLKNKREVERKLREETQAFEKDRVVWQERESELLDQLKALQDTVSVLAQQNEQVSERRDEENSYYAAARELKSVQRSIKELERRNNELTAEVDKAKQATTDSMNISKGHVRRIQQLENELSQVKHTNQSLMDENESFQRLMFEKTMKGEFVLNPILQLNEPHKHTDVIKKITDGISENALEAELNRADELSSSLNGERVHKESDHTNSDHTDKFQKEIKSLNDANKALRLYIEKILNRILEVKGFEEILDFEWKKPSVSTPVTPTSGTFGFNNNTTNNNNNNDNSQEKTLTTPKKVERRKTLSGWHFRSTSQPQNTYKADKISEESDVPLPSRKSNDDTLRSLEVPKRGLRRNSTSTKNAKRFSLFGGWGGGVKEEEKKEDPFMRPMILLQEQERK